MHINWKSVIPAMTTPFLPSGEVDHDFLAKHALWMQQHGCEGFVPLGSLGESATLSFGEKTAILSTLVQALQAKAPVIPGIAALSTQEAIELAQKAEELGCSGLMVLPPYVYSTDWREMKAHVKAVMDAVSLPCMLYNNPIAYKTDFSPEQVAELANECPNMVAVKESSSDVRRITAIKALLGERLTVLVGVDDLIMEGIQAGAEGWIAGLVNAYPQASVEVFKLAKAGKIPKALKRYQPFLPLLRLDTVPKFVQLIKYVQERVGMGSAAVRAPRLALTSSEKTEVDALVLAFTAIPLNVEKNM